MPRAPEAAPAAGIGRRASLPMYDLPELREANRSWWESIARGLGRAGGRARPGARALFRARALSGGRAPALIEGEPAERAWSDPDLLFSQACGYPLTHDFAGRLTPLATPAYAAPGCDGPCYSSALVVAASSRAADVEALRGGRVAVNYRSSHSGYNALRATVAPFARGRPFFGAVIESGAHTASLELVARGDADLASVDCVTHALLARHRPRALAGTRVLAYTARAPALPYVTSAGAGPAAVAGLRSALRCALADPRSARARADLLIAGLHFLDFEDYAPIDAIERTARDLAYPEIV